MHDLVARVHGREAQDAVPVDEAEHGELDADLERAIYLRDCSG